MKNFSKVDWVTGKQLFQLQARPVVLKPEHAPEPPKIWVEIQIMGSWPQSFWYSNSGVEPGNLPLSEEVILLLPLWTPLWEPLS